MNRWGPILKRDVPASVPCNCGAIDRDEPYHSYACKTLLWATLNPLPRKPCPTCGGSGVVPR